MPAPEEPAPEPAPKVMRFVQRAVAWYPNSQFELVTNTKFHTPSGSYRFVEVSRTCASRLLTGKPTMLVDESANTAFFIQLELKGLSSFGNDIDSFLEEGILGYTPDR